MDLMEACDVLQIRPSDDMAEIRKKYVELIRECHPDLTEDEKDKQEREERAKTVNVAYDCICSYRNQSVSSAEMFESIFEAFERIIGNYGDIVRDGNEFTVHVDLTREDLIWRDEQESKIWSAD